MIEEGELVHYNPKSELDPNISSSLVALNDDTTVINERPQGGTYDTVL